MPKPISSEASAPPASRPLGFSMVEVLVALVVLAVGMLGVASLFATSLRSGGSAISRMQAINLANDLADKIRANPTGALAYQGAATKGNCVGGAIGTQSCDSATMAANDLYVWQQQITATWPSNAAGQVTVTAVAGTPLYTYQIQITWKDAAESQTQSYILRAQL